ncbi:S-layer homology domain-containing protein [Paenibacillus sp. N3.4]|uniref:S-layer homology domain-containing protein n=1 Tax=Paenibacillus sp. N3.4 TaxID=2603222 RepID=UPI0011CC20EA|nr:S-layer homology domain-containing protein [Paenibacillus sp. N3.4]TXK74649.1 S-layer homology domain-containing protein [Paenibacillus sp. N3.4]
MNNKKLASAIVTSLIVTSLAGTPVFAASTTPTTPSNAGNSNNVKLSFPDVKSDYWGIRHISKLALEGIIEGVEDGTYRPETASLSKMCLLWLPV